MKALVDANSALLHLRNELDSKTASLVAATSELQSGHEELVEMQAVQDETERECMRYVATYQQCGILITVAGCE